MTIPRIYVAQDLPPASIVTLDAAASHHLLNVLRLQKGAEVLLFNDKGGEVVSHFVEVKQHLAVMQLEFWQGGIPESPLFTYLGQGVARGEKMDFIIQKAVELGINIIAPLITDHSNAKFDSKRAQERLAHWQKIAVHASEQSGRCKLAQVLPIQSLSAWVSALGQNSESTKDQDGELKLTLEPPIATASIAASSVKPHYAFSPECSYQNKKPKNIIFAAGSEGGFSLREKKTLFENHFSPCLLGPRILRTETAALVALSIFQARWGDIAN